MKTAVMKRIVRMTVTMLVAYSQNSSPFYLSLILGGLGGIAGLTGKTIPVTI